MPRRNHRPQRNRKTHYWQKHHLKRVEAPIPDEPEEILVSVTITRHCGKNAHCTTRYRAL